MCGLCDYFILVSLIQLLNRFCSQLLMAKVYSHFLFGLNCLRVMSSLLSRTGTIIINRVYLFSYHFFFKHICRFDIVEPVMEPVGEDNFEMCLRIREDLKRFRKEYIKPVQFR